MNERRKSGRLLDGRMDAEMHDEFTTIEINILYVVECHKN